MSATQGLWLVSFRYRRGRGRGAGGAWAPAAAIFEWIWRIFTSEVRGEGGEARALARASHLRRGQWARRPRLRVPNVGILGDLRGGGVGAREGGRVQARAFASTGIAGVAEPAPFEAPVPPRVVPPHFGQSGVYVGGGGRPSPARSLCLLVRYIGMRSCV